MISPADDSPNVLSDPIQAALEKQDPLVAIALVVMGLFAASFSAEALVRITNMSEVVSVLDTLHAEGLLEPAEAIQGQIRYTLLSPIHDHARQKLHLFAEAEQLRKRFIDFYVHLTYENDHIEDPAKRAILELEWPNALAATEYAKSEGDWKSMDYLASYLGEFLLWRGLVSECEQLYRDALNMARVAGQREMEGRILTCLGVACKYQSRWEEATACYHESLSIQRELGDKRNQGTTLANLGNLYRRQGQWEKATAYYLQSLPYFRELNNREEEGMTMEKLGHIYLKQGRWEKARDCYTQSLSLSRELGDRHSEARAFEGLGHAYMWQSLWEEAIACYQNSLSIHRERKDNQGEISLLGFIAFFYTIRKDLKRARAWALQALSVLEPTGDEQGKEKIRELLSMLEADLAKSGESGPNIDPPLGFH